MSRQFLKTAASRTATAIGAATVAAVVVAGSLSVAQAATEAIPNNSVTSAKIVNGTIQGIDIKPGAVGPGQLGVNARPRWAKVDAGLTTTLIRGRGAVSASRIGVGIYAVTFASPITNCGWTATRNDNDAGVGPAGEVAVERGSSTNAFTLWVRTFNSAGALTESADNDGFTLVASC
jgi:hypothetical protein